MADEGPVEVLVVNRWRRYGHDRLYVQDQSGQRLGYHDVKTGTDVIEDHGRVQEFRKAIEAYSAGRQTGGTGPSSPSSPPSPSQTFVPQQGGKHAAPAQLPVERPWTDLASNRPGDGVRRRADAERQKAPFSTRVARVLGVHTPERAWRLGAEGETAVGDALARVSEDWRALHSVPLGDRGSDIDHVVIGRGGVYTINAKHHPDAQVVVNRDTVLVNGVKQLYVRNSRFESNKTGELLSRAVGYRVPVVGLVVLVGVKKGTTVKSQPADGRVVVLPYAGLTGWLAARGSILDSQQCDVLYQAARRSTLWTE